VWKKLQKVLPKKNSPLSQKFKKVGPIWQNFIREYPYEPPKTPEKVNFSGH